MPVKTAQKSRPDFSLEKSCQGIVCGIDEVGRGPLAGPVMAACAYVPESARRRHFLRDVNDSKKLTLKKREQLYEVIRENCHYGFGTVSPAEIDELNIHHATLLAMRRAYEDMQKAFGARPELALVDGKFAPNIDCNCQTVTKGDSVSLSIAAASILAKVKRDRFMARLHEEHPHYGWATNAGYGTAEHLAGIQSHGVTEYHRKSFAPVRLALSESESRLERI